MNLLYSNRSQSDQDFIQLVCNDILKNPIRKKEELNDFCGIFIEGRNREVNCLEDTASIHSFKTFSQYNYPVFMFLSNPNNVLNAHKDYLERNRINIIQIKELNSLSQYTDFCVKELYHLLPNDMNNYAVTISPDSMFIKSGWEEKVKDFSYIGAPWLHTPSIEIFDNGQWKQFSAPTRIGNGGGSIRKIIHCKRASKQYGHLKLREKGTENKFPSEDLFFSSIFKSVGLKLPTVEEASEIVIDPMDYEDYINKKSFMFHYFSAVNPWKIKK